MTDIDGSISRQLRFLIPYLKPHRRIIGFSLSLSLLSTALGMVQPYFSKILIDQVFMTRNRSLLFPLLALMVVLFLFSFAFRTANNFLYTAYSAKLLFKLRNDLFDHLHRVPLHFIFKQKIGDLYSRIASDMADIQGFLTDLVPQFLFNCLTCLLTGTILVWLNWKMALLSFLFLPAGLLIVYRLRPKLLTLSREIAENNAHVAHFLFESLGNTHLVRSFGAENLEGNKLEEKHGQLLTLLIRSQTIAALSRSVPTLFIIVNTLVVFGYGGIMVLNNDITIGSLVAFSIYQGRVFAPLQGMMDGFLAMQKSKVAFTRVTEMLDVPPETEHIKIRKDIAAERIRGAISFQDVCFGYDPGSPVLNRLSFEVPPGGITALLGPSGVGKTTICHLAARLFTPQQGTILLDGVDMKHIPKDVFKKTVCLISQDIFLFHTSILENIRFSNPRADREQVIDAARAACIHDYIQTLPAGYDSIVGDRGTTLSGGQKQRLCIARAILLNPKVLIMDEATAFLDGEVENRLRQTLAGLMDNRTIIIVSHRPSSVVHADKTVVLGRNGIEYDGPTRNYQSIHEHEHRHH